MNSLTQILSTVLAAIGRFLLAILHLPHRVERVEMLLTNHVEHLDERIDALADREERKIDALEDAQARFAGACPVLRDSLGGNPRSITGG